MAEYIDRQAAIDALGERPMTWTGGDYELGCANQYDSDKLAIKTVRSADAVEVVRCKDCKYRIPFTTRGGYFTYICAIEYELSDPYDLTRSAEDGNWYCADGERKE